MIPRPNLEEFVFIQVLQEVENFSFDQTDPIQLKKDDIYLFPFDKISFLYKQKIVRLLWFDEFW